MILKKEHNDKIKSNKIIAIITLVVLFVTMSMPLNYAFALDSRFLQAYEMIPPNNVLFSNKSTGIVSNPNNINIVATCCQMLPYYGVIWATTDANYGDLKCQNVNGQFLFKDFVHTITYNNTVIYCSAEYMDGRTTTNNYTYVEFNNDFTPASNLANEFYDYVVQVTSGGNGGNNNASNINYSLPAGNIAIIETDSSYSFINLTTTMPLQSTSFASNPWPNTTQRIGLYSTLPQSLNPTTMGNVIEWERNGNTTLFNITTSAKYNPSVVSTFKYVVIANPYYYPANDMEGHQFTNGAINISMDGVVNITVKSLTATVNTQTGEVEDNYNGEEWTGEVDETTNDIIWTDSNGENNAPTEGGNLSDPSITGFQSWLKGILNNIVNIFQPAHDAINTLSSAVSNFASWLYALYVWLPSPILSLLTSAISLAIVIGIIKVFI